MVDKTVPPDLGARLNAARQRLGIGVSELAGLCDVSRDHMHDLLAGRRVPGGVIARRLIESLQLDDETADLLLHDPAGRYLSTGGFGTVQTS